MIDALARRPAALRVVLAVVSGVLTALAFQPFNLWPLAFLGVAGLSLTVLAARGYRGRPATVCCSGWASWDSA